MLLEGKERRKKTRITRRKANRREKIARKEKLLAFLKKIFRALLLILFGCAICTVFWIVLSKSKDSSEQEPKEAFVEETEIATEEEETETEPERKFKQIKLLLEEHTISNPSSGENRNINMAIAASLINRTILQPEEKLLWSEKVGPTTKEKGYKEAGVIKNRKSATDLGGGVCQVSSTLYSAVYDAGIIQEGKFFAEAHTLSSPYIDPKVDHEATVAVDHEPITDFWFENTLECPIEIEAWTEGGSVTVRIYAIVYVEEMIQN